MAKSKLAVTVLSFMFAFNAWCSGTIGGNGGDPLYYFLETTRNVLVETIAIYRDDPKARERFCAKAPGLADESQKALCRAFLNETFGQILNLNSISSSTSLILKDSLLPADGPDGEIAGFPAATSLGPEGPIFFHRDSVLNYSPSMMLFLMAHEFGHKVCFQNRFVQDNDFIPRFGKGRLLLDSVASAVVDLAISRRKIGTAFGLRDVFRCQIIPQAMRGQIVGVTGSSPRLFQGAGFDVYQTSLSRMPEDTFISIQETEKTSIAFRVQIDESAGCRSDAPVGSRSTQLEVLRVHDPNPDGTVPPDEILASQTLADVNPICEKEPRWLELSSAGVEFRCQYRGTQGATQ